MVEHWTTNILHTNEATLPPLPECRRNNEYINHELTINIAEHHKYFDPLQTTWYVYVLERRSTQT